MRHPYCAVLGFFWCVCVCDLCAPFSSRATAMLIAHPWDFVESLRLLTSKVGAATEALSNNFC